MPHSVLQIPVPQLEPVVRPRLERRSPEYVPADPYTTAAHITVLGPFADPGLVDDGLVSELRSFFSDVLPFAFTLDRISDFPDGTAYLAPDPAAPFLHLTHELFRLFPEYPPYGGRFDDVVPHLNLPLVEGEGVDALRFELAPHLPVTAHAREAVLFWWEPGGSRALEEFPFGTTAA